jgi:hypothetical protein
MVYRLVFGTFAIGLGALFWIEGEVSLGFGRHGAPWWKPFTNELTTAHVENLATLAFGLLGIVLGTWIVGRALSGR